MPVWVRVIIIVLAVIIGILIALIIVGRKMQKKQQASQADIEAASQIISMLVIDKKKMKVKDATLPKVVAEQIPKYMRFAKLPLVKAKVGPKVMTLIADVKVFDALPLKTEVKVAVSGIYITEIKYIRGKVEPKPLTKKEQRAKAKAAKKAK
ncbi:MAG: hypothetical protein KH378_05035 [Butyrivibrio sp.]|mgnify:FL=1|nr:hypothetical protein [Butyrivibrio sp.]